MQKQISCRVFNFCKVSLTVYMSTLRYGSYLFLYFFVRFFNAARIGYTFGCHYYPTNLNSLDHCI